MKNRRLFAVLLAAVLMLSALPITALAAGTTYSVTVSNNGEPIEITGATGADAASTDNNYTVKLLPQDPDKCKIYKIEIKTGYTWLGSLSYTYDAATGELTIPKDHIYGNVNIYTYTAKNPDLTTATEITAPYTTQFRYVEADNNIRTKQVGNHHPVRMFKIDLEQSDRLNVKLFCGDSPDLNTAVELYRIDEYTGRLCEVNYYDNNMYPVDYSSAKGESSSFAIQTTGTYVIFACSNDAFSDVEGKDITMHVSVGKTSVTIPEGDPLYTGQLDFTDAANLPTPGADALWSWDQATLTLTLKDGFYIDTNDNDYYTRISAIILPANANMVVEGSAHVIGDWLPIDFSHEDEECTSEIRLNEGAKLTLISPDTSGMYVSAYTTLNIIGTVGAGGTLPELNVQSRLQGISCEGRPLSIKNVKLDIVSGKTAISGAEGKSDFTLENCMGSLFSLSGGGIALGGNRAHYPNISIIDSTLTIHAGSDAIYTKFGSINITDSDTTIISENGKGIYIDNEAINRVDGDVSVSGGKFIARALSNAINSTGGLYFTDDVVYYLETIEANSHYTAISAYGDTMSFCGTFRLIDCYGQEAYIGEWHYPDLKENYRYGLVDVEGYGSTSIICSVLETGEVGLEGLSAEYTKGNTASFTAKPGLPETLIHANDGYLPTSWNVVGTDLSGSWDKNPYTASFDTSGLTCGETYTLQVEYKRATYEQFNGWTSGGWKFVSAEEEVPDDAVIARAVTRDTITKTYTFKIAEAAPTPTPTPTPTTPTVTPSSDDAPASNKTTADTSNTTTTVTSAQTGDSSFFVISSLMLLIAAAVSVSIVYYRKKIYNK